MPSRQLVGGSCSKNKKEGFNAASTLLQRARGIHSVTSAIQLVFLKAKLYTRSITCVFPSLLLELIVDLGSAKQVIALLGTRGHKN